MYSMVGHQPASVQTIALGAARNGKLNGIRHDSVSPTSVFDNYIEYAALCPRSLWGASGIVVAPAILTNAASILSMGVGGYSPGTSSGQKALCFNATSRSNNELRRSDVVPASANWARGALQTRSAGS